MPTNKNAVIRYRHIDKMLSSKHKHYTTQEIADYVNEQLQLDGFYPVSLRCIQKDIKALEEEVFMAELKREIRGDGKECVFYEDPSFSIFTKKLSDDEEHLLSEMLNTIGQFDGLDNFEWLDGLKTKLNVKENRKIILFDTNPDYLSNSNILGTLFTAIVNKQVIALDYHIFSSPNNPKRYIIHPYLLKQYNNRWFLIAAAEDGYILTFALDRIDSFEPLYDKQYKEPSEDLSERFEDIIGVTIYKEHGVEKILLWVSNSQWPYIDTKPIHSSQRHIKGDKAEELSKRYGMDSGQFIELRCIINHELKKVLASYMDDVVILSPVSLRNEMTERITRLAEKYKNEIL